MADHWSPTTPWFNDGKKTAAVWPTWVCRNPSCPSRGKSHPNCRCGAPSFSQQSKNLEYDAYGGQVGNHHCNSNLPHQEGCEFYATGGEIKDNQEFHDHPDLAIDHAAVAHGLLHILTKTGHSKSPDPNKSADDFRNHARAGKNALHNHLNSTFDKQEEMKADREGVKALRDHLQSIQENPQQLLDVGGNLGASFPDHALALGAKTAQAVNYLQSIKPRPQQNAPLDDISKPDPLADSNYHRQLEIAQNPLMALQLAKQGRSHPADLQTINALYPKLGESMKNGVGASLIQAKVDGKPISYKHKQGLSAILGQPVDSTQSPQAMRAIIAAQAPPAPKAAPPKKGKTGATAETQKTIKEVDAMYQTPDQARLLDRRT